MAASKDALHDNINNRLVVGGLTDLQASQLAGAAGALCEAAFFSVPNVASLPPASLNKGRFIYIRDLCAYRYSDGTIWTSEFSKLTNGFFSWGCNFCGQLGDGTNTNRSSPGSILGGSSNWTLINGGQSHGLGVKNDGSLWAWGGNTEGQLGFGDTTSRSSPTEVLSAGKNWSFVSAGGNSSAGIKTDGTLWTWGVNLVGQLGDNSTVGKSSPVTVAGGGTTWCAVSHGGTHAAAIKTDGTLWTWGSNGNGQLGDGSVTNRSSPVTTSGGGTNWCAVSAGDSFTVAIKTDGTLWTWGSAVSGRLGNNSGSGGRSSPGTTIAGGTNWCSVSAKHIHVLAVKTDGTLWAWGCNAGGQLGDGSVTSRVSPVTSSGGGTDWRAVSTGTGVSSAIKTDGTLWTWGCNLCGALGTGDLINRSSPGTILGGGTTWKSISNSERFMFASKINRRT